MVTLYLEGVYISPAKADGSPWDGFVKPNASLLNAVTEALTGADLLGLLHALAGELVEGLQKPDPYGEATLTDGENTVTRHLDVVHDTLIPGWDVSWGSLLVHPNVQLRVKLFDKDMVHDDYIGTTTLSGDHIVEALNSGGTQTFIVATSHKEQILAVTISAIRE